MAITAASAEELADQLWDSLNEDNKVSLFVRYIDLRSGYPETVIINKHVNAKQKASIWERKLESIMTELELKYGCNPNQKPARIFMEEGELPLKVLNGKPGYINFMDALNSWQLVKALKEATGLPAAASFKHVSPAGAALGLPLTDVERHIYFAPEGTSPPSPAPTSGPGAPTGCAPTADWAALSDVCDAAHRPLPGPGGLRRRHRPRLHRRGPGHPEDQAQGRLQRGADRPQLRPAPLSAGTSSASPLSRATTTWTSTRTCSRTSSPRTRTCPSRPRTTCSCPSSP